MVLVVPFVIFAVAGNTLFAWLTDGKYDNLTPLFLGFFVVAILASVNSVMDIIVKLLEEARIYSATNIVRSSAIVLAIPLIQQLGLRSLVVANFLGLLVALAIIFRRLRACGRRIRVDGGSNIRIIAFAACAIGLGNVMVLMEEPAVLAAIARRRFFRRGHLAFGRR